MNIIAKSVTNLARVCLGRAVEGSSLALSKYNYVNNTRGSILTAARKCLETSMQGLQQVRTVTTLWKLHTEGDYRKKKKKKNPLDGKPFAKGVVLKTLIKKPKKPNSANRKCVLVRLSTGKEMIAFVPGIGHSLQEHNIVLVRNGRCKDVPGVKIRCVRGKYDLPHVIKQKPK